VNKKKDSKRAKCRICQEPEINRIWEMPTCVYGDLFTPDKNEALRLEKKDLCLSICSSCGLLQLDEETDLKVQYDNYLYKTKITFGLAEFYEVLAEKLSIEVHGQRRKALDIGSNDGSFLRSLKDKKFSVLGVEPAESPAKIANESGILTIRKYFDSEMAVELLRDFGKFELVTMNYALANVPKIAEIFQGVKTILAEGGIFSVVTGYHVDQFAVNMFDYVGHDHLTYLTIRDLKFIGKIYGLDIFKVERVEHKGGSIVVYFCNSTNERQISNSVHQLLQREEWQQINSTEFILNLRSRVDEQRDSLLEYLQMNKIEKVLGIGASISTTYLANYFGITGLIANLFDDDETKWNLYAPGSGVKVLPINIISQLENTTAVLLAWQHTNRILKRLKENRFQGTLLIPLPYFRKITF
jgi:hypothetical protein